MPRFLIIACLFALVLGSLQGCAIIIDRTHRCDHCKKCPHCGQSPDQAPAAEEADEGRAD